jgi:hypothetical protein
LLLTWVWLERKCQGCAAERGERPWQNQREMEARKWWQIRKCGEAVIVLNKWL